MTTLHFRKANGDYIGGFEGSSPIDGIECTAPPHGESNWDGVRWNDRQEKIDRDYHKLAKNTRIQELLDAVRDPAVKELLNFLKEMMEQE